MFSYWLLVCLTWFHGTNLIQAAGIFPLGEIYKTSIIFDQMLEDPNFYFDLEEYYLCKNSTTKDNGEFCSCVKSCTTNGMCCLDYFWYQPEWNNKVKYFPQTLTAEYTKFVVTKTNNNQSCQPIVPQPETTANNIKIIAENIIMISSCPTNTDVKDVTTLPTPVQILPTYGNDNNVYINPSTAKCNNISEFVLLPINASCDNVNQSASESVPEFSQCSYRVSLPEKLKVHIKVCHAENTCKGLLGATNKLNAELCTSYSGKVQMNNTIYNNIHCTMCASSKTKIWIGPDALRQEAIMPYSTVISYGDGPASVIHGNKGNRIKRTLGCRGNEIYDVARKQCLPFICSAGYKQNGFQCVKKGFLTTNEQDIGIGLLDDFPTRVNKCIFARQNKPYIIIDATDSLLNFSSILTQHNLIKTISETDTIFSIPLTNNMNMTQQTQRIQKITEENNAGNNVKVRIVSNKFTETEMYPRQVEHSFPEGKMCFKPLFHTATTLEIDSKCNLIIKNEIFTPNNYVMRIDILNGNKVVAITCEKYHLYEHCPKRNIPSRNYTLYSNGSTIIQDILYQIGEYTPMLKGIGICVETLVTGLVTNPKPKWITDVELGESYITMVACALSIVFYGMTIVVCLRTKELREIPGRNVVCVCFVLMCGDIFILGAGFVDPGKYPCYVIAIILHFFLLSSHAWSTVISFEIWFTLRKHTSARFIYTPKRFYWYCAYAFMLPLVSIIVFSLLDSTKIIQIEYGRPVCWIGNFYFALYLYLIPVAVASCFNISVLGFILHQIYIQQGYSKKLLKKSSDNDDIKLAKTALKLILLLGIVEVIGFIQIPRNNESAIIIFNFIVRFLFTFMRGLRGLFIWVLFVYMDKRTWNYQRCSKKRAHSLEDTPTVATKSSRTSYKITNHLLQHDTKM